MFMFNAHMLIILILESPPSDLQLKLLKELITCGVKGEKILTKHKVIGHKQVRATLCPGKYLYDIIKSFPNWEANPK